MESAPERYFLEMLFNRFNESGLRYAVMRNYRTLPCSAGGSDLDLLVHPLDASLARELVFEAIRNAGGAVIGVAETVGFLKINALGRLPSKQAAWWGLCVDVNSGLYFNGIRLLTENESFPVLFHNGIAVLPDAFAGVLGVLKEVLNNETYPARYAQAARAALHEWKLIARHLAPMGGAALALLHSLVSADIPPDEQRSLCLRLRRELFRHGLAHQPLKTTLQITRYQWSKVRRYLKPSGVVIAVLGVDGAGKSTVIDSVLPELRAATHNVVWIQHLRPGLLPPLARLKGKTNVPVGPVVEPHGSNPSATFGSLLRLSYLTLDYILGYWLWTRPKLAKQPAIVLFDRYAYDMALDPRRFRIGLPGWMAGWFASLVPRPSLIVCLQAAPEVIASRKKELPLEETRRQVDALRDFARSKTEAVLISTDTNIASTKNQVLQSLYHYLQKRTNEAVN